MYHSLYTLSLSDSNLLGMIPDEEAMMNFAIAISLHDEVHVDIHVQYMYMYMYVHNYMYLFLLSVYMYFFVSPFLPPPPLSLPSLPPPSLSPYIHVCVHV